MERSLLDIAIDMATHAHAGQVDKGGQPYILHPLRVMLSLGHNATEEQRIVAMLHDVVEDSSMDLETIAAVFDDRVVAAVDAITRRPGESYRSYIGRVAYNELAARVKRADLADNLDPSRQMTSTLPSATITRYREAVARLTPRC